VLTWRSVEEWYGQLCNAAHASAQQFEGKSVGVARRIAAEQRIRNLNERTFLNNLTPTTGSHHLRLEEFWHLLDVTGAKHPLHVVARQRSQLVAPVPDPEAVSMSALFGAFSLRKREITETQELVYSVLERKQPFSSIAARESLLREVYEDFCESISILLKLQTITPNLKNVESRIWQQNAAMRLYHCTQAVSEFAVHHSNELIHDSVLPANRVQRLRSPEESGRLSLRHFLQLLEKDSGGRLLEALLESLGFKSYPLPPLTWQPTHSNLMDSYSDLEQRQADTISRIRGALDDGVITVDELKDIRQELEEEYQAEVTLIMSLPVIHSMSEP